MSAARHLAAVPGEGTRDDEELVMERPRLLSAVGRCQECAAAVLELPTLDGPRMFDATPVPMSDALVVQGGAYVMVRPRPGVAVVVDVRGLPVEVRADVVTALTPHTHASCLDIPTG